MGKDKQKVNLKIILIAVFLAVLGYFAAVGVFEKYIRYENSTLDQSQPQPQQNYYLETQEQRVNEQQLDQCIEKARDILADTDTTSASDEQLKLLLDLRQNEIDNCYKRYPIN